MLISEFDENIISLFNAVRFLRIFINIPTSNLQNIVNSIITENNNEPSIVLQKGMISILQTQIKEMPLWSLEMIQAFFDKNPRKIFDILKTLIENEDSSEYFRDWIENFLNYLVLMIRWQDLEMLKRIEDLNTSIAMEGKLDYTKIKNAFFGHDKYFKGEVGLTWILTPIMTINYPWLMIKNKLETEIWERNNIEKT